MIIDQVQNIENLPPLIAYLDAIGALDGDERTISMAKKHYRRIYKKLHRRKMRNSKREVVISFEKHEKRILKRAADDHNQPLSTFVREAALAYLSQCFIILDSEQILQIESTLVKIYSMARRHGATGQVLTRLSEIESGIVQQLKNPKLLIESLRTALQENPEFRSQLLDLI